MIQAVVIDVDDTLCLTESICFELENEALKTMGRPPMTRGIHVATWGQPLFDAIQLRSPGISTDDFYNAYHPVLASFIANGRLDSIPEANYVALDALAAMGKALFILTSRTHSELKHLLKPDHLLASRIAGFYHKDTTKYHKPDPRVFDELLRDHRLDPAVCAYVGDSVGDGLAAKGAGMHFIASLESGLRQESDFAEVDADGYIRAFPEIVETISMMDNRLRVL